MRSLLVVMALVELGACAAPEKASKPEPTKSPEAPAVKDDERVTLVLARRVPAGTKWAYSETYESKSLKGTVEEGAKRRRYALEANVTMVSQDNDREVLDLEVTRHEHMKGQRRSPGTIAAGEKVRVERAMGTCNVLVGGAPLSTYDKEQFADSFDCSLPTAEKNDDVLYNTSAPRKIGERWEMNKDNLKRMMGAFEEPNIKSAEVTLEAADEMHGIAGYRLVATFDAEVKSNTEVIHIRGRLESFVPRDLTIPVLMHTSTLESGTDTQKGVYTTVRSQIPLPQRR